MSISAHFIRRPVATTLLTIGLALSGVIGLRLLPVSPLPHVDFPTIMVSASLPGAEPQTMATSVAAPLERQFGLISGVTEMTSSSTLGSTTIVLQFDLNRDIDGAARDVQAAINAARSYLPANLPSNPTYRKVNPAEAPILIVALTSDTVTVAKMYDAASSILAQKLSQVRGVGQVFVGGGSLPAVRVELKPPPLNGYGISLETVRAVLSSTSANRPKGQLSDETKTWEIETNDQLFRAEQYHPVYVAYDNSSGAGVRLTDVAGVEDSVEDVRTAGLVNGKPAAMVVVFRQPAANIIGTVDRVRAVLPQMAGSLPGGVNLSVVLDRTPPIRGSLLDVEFTLVLSAVLVILVVFAFLRSVRSTAVPGVAVAVSLVGTFGVMYLLGYSLDNLSLMALTIATGFVVDDAIVVLENITRHIEQGMDPMQAAYTGAKEIAFTVVSMSTSLVAVFIPILLMGGMVGRLFREFAVTLSIAVAMSLVISLTVTPMMCARLPKRQKTGRRNPAYRLSEAIFNRMHAIYAPTLRWSLRHPLVMLFPTIIAVCLSIYLFTIIPKGFFPEQDTGRLLGIVQADQDISFQSMKEKLTQVVDIIRRDPDVESVSAFTGAASGSSVNQARMFVALKPFNERKASSDGIIARLRAPLGGVTGAPTYLQPVQDLRIGGRLSAGLYQYTLQGQDVTELNRWGSRVLAMARTLPELRDASSDQQDRGLQAAVVIDRNTASRLGITPQLIDNTLYDAFGQRQVSLVYTLLNQYHLVMEAAPEFWQRPETLDEIYVQSATRGMVPLSAFTHFSRTDTALAVNHQAQFPAVTVSFNLAPGVSLGEAVSAVDEATIQMGLPASIRGSFQGTAEAFLASLSNEPLLILAALLTVYIVLGVLYESYIHPITILSTLPSAGVGALLALLLFRMDLSVIAVIGIILLIGIVKKNGIMMVDFALDAERREGKTPLEAIYQASLLRFRPIMMTTMAALLGALPLALGRGVGSELRRPLGVAIVGGLVISQLLTLYTTPVIYLYMDRLRLRLRRRSPKNGAPVAPLLLIACASLLFVSCSVGPDYVRPSVETPAAYKELSGWKEAHPQDHVGRGAWWLMFDDPELDTLEAQVNISNQNIAVAEAQFRQALAQVRIARAGYFPTLTAGSSVTRSGSSSTLSTSAAFPGTTITEWILPIQLSWEIDVWGRVRRLVEANVANAQASAADVESARLSAQALLAQDYFQLRGLDAQKKLLDDTVVAYRKTLEITKNQYRYGIAASGDVALAETQLETAVAQAVDIGVQRAQLEHAIAVLIGKPASGFSITSVPEGPVAPVPHIPAGVPSELLERRPDVAAAERAAAAANAQIGVAVSAYYPAVTIDAAGGFESFQLSKWLTWPSRFWSLGPGVSEVVYEGGLRRAQTDQARAAYDAAVASYRQTVLTAFQQVEDNLAGLRILEEEAKAQDRAVKAAVRSLSQALNQYKFGTTSYLTVVTAQAALLTNQRSAISIAYRRTAAAVLLVQALGGGWSDRDLPQIKRGSVKKGSPAP